MEDTLSSKSDDNKIVISYDVLMLTVQIKRWKDEGLTKEEISQELNRFCNLGWTTDTIIKSANALDEIYTKDQITSLFSLVDDDWHIKSNKWIALKDTLKRINQQMCEIATILDNDDG